MTCCSRQRDGREKRKDKELVRNDTWEVLGSLGLFIADKIWQIGMVPVPGKGKKEKAQC